MCAKYIFVVCAIVISLVSAEHNVHYDKEQSLKVQPTEAPLMSSTIAPPVRTNVAPKVNQSKKSEIKVSTKTQEFKEQPMQVTGFITANGTIYEVEDKNGVGQIEARQNGHLLTPETGEFICNYGSVVVYSDRPCKEVADVKKPTLSYAETKIENTVKIEDNRGKDHKQSSGEIEQVHADDNTYAESKRKEQKNESLDDTTNGNSLRKTNKQMIKNRKKLQKNRHQNVPNKFVLRTRNKKINANERILQAKPMKRPHNKRRRQQQQQHKQQQSLQKQHQQKRRRPQRKGIRDEVASQKQRRDRFATADGKIYEIYEVYE